MNVIMLDLRVIFSLYITRILAKNTKFRLEAQSVFLISPTSEPITQKSVTKSPRSTALSSLLACNLRTKGPIHWQVMWHSDSNGGEFLVFVDWQTLEDISHSVGVGIHRLVVMIYLLITMPTAAVQSATARCVDTPPAPAATQSHHQ